MTMTLAKLNQSRGIPLNYANRHGLITGPTGSGKSVTLMRLVEQFSRQGVPAFVADVKGDLVALSRSCPVEALDLFGREGRQIRATVQGFGPDLLSRALELSDTQSAIVEIAFALAAEHAAPLETLDDLREILKGLSATPEIAADRYGHVARSTVAVVMRALARLEAQGGKAFFGAPAFDVADLMAPVGNQFRAYARKPSGENVSILASASLMQSPRVYSAFLLWLLSDLYERLPEIGDRDKPRLVFFFDEAHLLFSDCPPALLRKIEQTVRLIRSKGVGVYFVSQSPEDVPPIIREQLAHRIEHSRALPVGTAKVATMSPDGRALPIETVKIQAPECELGTLSETERQLLQPAECVAPIAAVQAVNPPYLAMCIALAMVSIPIGFATWAAWEHGAKVLWIAAGLLVACLPLARRRR